MNLKRKLLLSSATGLLGIGLTIGGGTYALFHSSASNTNNAFTAGTLEVSNYRDDVPNLGPMFYTENTNDNYGAMPTGLWAPGDKNTRGLFLENTGSLEAKLTSLSVFPTNRSATKVSSSSTGSDLDAYNDAQLFAKQSNVIIWEIIGWDPTNDMKKPIDYLDGTGMDFLMDTINDGYQLWLTENPNADLTAKEKQLEVVNSVNDYMLTKLNDNNPNANKKLFKVEKMYNQKLSNLVNNPFDASSFGISVAPQQAVLLGFTVEMMKNPPANSGIERNSMQGKNVYFTFGSSWVQTKNNK